jgi:hypothetical protein
MDALSKMDLWSITRAHNTGGSAQGANAGY